MSAMFPYSNIVAGVLVLLVGFVFHWVGQLISILDWDLAVRLGLQEKDALPEYLVYEKGTAAADVALGWIFGVAGVGLILGASWGFKLAWFPGVVLIYHGLCAWFWYGNAKRAGHTLLSDSFRVVWCLANLVTGILAVAVAWRAA